MNTLLQTGSDVHYATNVAEIVYKSLSLNKEKSSIYDSLTPPPITISSYLLRWVDYAECGASALMMGVIYVDRFCNKTDTKLTRSNMHRIILVSLLVATKICNDTCWSNKYYADIGGVCLQELNRLEEDFLLKIEWDLFITNKEMEYYISKIR
jgi:hypothetical protein